MTHRPCPSLRVRLLPFTPDLADGWALFLDESVADRTFTPLQDDTGTPYTTDWYELRYLRERLTWADGCALLAFVRSAHGPQYLGPDSLVAVYPDGDRRALSPAQAAAEFEPSLPAKNKK
jgi:hypothetical protein